MRKYGATVHAWGDTYADAFRVCNEYVKLSSDRVNVSTGRVEKYRAYKTLAWELEDLQFKNVFVPAGTLTLACGIAKYFDGTVYACMLPSHPFFSKREELSLTMKETFSSVSVNVYDRALLFSLKDKVVPIPVPSKMLQPLLVYRWCDDLLKILDPCVTLPTWIEKRLHKPKSVIIATGVSR
jgi:hypothetical protein